MEDAPTLDLVHVLPGGFWLQIDAPVWGRHGKAKQRGDSGPRRTGFRGEAEQRSGLIPNTIPG